MNQNFEQSLISMTAASGWNHTGLSLTPNDALYWLTGAPQTQSSREITVRLDEQQKERTRIARELHDTLFQGFLGASMVLHSTVENMPADSPEKPSLRRALELMRRVIDQGRCALRGLRATGLGGSNLEEALAAVGEELPLGGTSFRVLVMGQPKALNPAAEEQIYLICREALVNALRHSAATCIEVDIEYLRDRVRVVIRDNGCGIDPEALAACQDSHWGLQGMRERSASIGARLRVLSRPASGTEVEISLPDAFADSHDAVSLETELFATRAQSAPRRAALGSAADRAMAAHSA